jgi:hypothetical protein
MVVVPDLFLCLRCLTAAVQCGKLEPLSRWVPAVLLLSYPSVWAVHVGLNTAAPDELS